MDRSLKSLDPRFEPIARDFLADLTEAKIPVLIVNTRRTAEEQAQCVAKGVSWVAHSKHEVGLAMDIVPYQRYTAHGDVILLWDSKDPIWQRVGELAEGRGLRWGGRFRPRPDLGHVEYIVHAVVNKEQSA
jgi:peptidoglycan L-alanyl-D-glutamate endopeptidase CwlK